MSRAIGFAITCDDVCRVNTDLLILKHADGFHGADDVVANALRQTLDLSLDQLAKQINEDGYFLTPTSQAIQASLVLFVKTPRLTQLYYPQIRDFANSALYLATKYAPDTAHVAMTIHGADWGLDTSVAFLAQLTGVITAVVVDSIPANLRGISIVERDPQRAALLALLLSYRFEGEPYVQRFATGAIHRCRANAVEPSS